MSAARQGQFFFRLLLLAAFLHGVLEVRAQSDAKVYGTVKDETGATFSGASLTLYSADRVRELKSDADGKFAFMNLPPGAYELRSQSFGFNLDVLEGITVKDQDVGPLQILLVGLPSESICGDEPIVSYEQGQEGKVKLTGKVLALGTLLSPPIVDATLTLSREGKAQLLQRSSENGDFHFDDVEPGEYILSTQKAPYLSPLPADIWITRQNLTRVLVHMEGLGLPGMGCSYPVPVRHAWLAQGSRGR